MAQPPTDRSGPEPPRDRGTRIRGGHGPEGRGLPGAGGPGPGTAQVLALLALGLVLFNYPILSLVARSEHGVPWLWIGLFGVWAGFIGLIRLLHRQPERTRDRA